MPKFRDQQKDESRAAYLMRVAAIHIEKYASEDVTHYDAADCDGSCLLDELKTEADNLDPENA